MNKGKEEYCDFYLFSFISNILLLMLLPRIQKESRDEYYSLK